jgi:hypothetical protein
MNRAAVGFLAFIILIILVMVLIFGGGGTKKQTTKISVPTIMALPDYASTNATTSMTIDGRVNGDELHRAIRITIGQNQRQLDIIQGYSGHVISSQSFYNTQDAYNVFLRAINNSGFLLHAKKTKIAVPADERGLCPLGNRYIFELDQNGSTLSRLWASDCGVAVGTLGGSSSLLQSLFEAQVPKYQTLVGNVQL